MVVEASVVDSLAYEVARRYRDLKQRSPRGRVDYSSVLLEVITKSGFHDAEDIAAMRSQVSKKLAELRRPRKRKR